MMTSSLPKVRGHPYLTAPFLLVQMMTLAQATEDPADHPSPIIMQAPMPAGHEMPAAELVDPMPEASMDPAQPGKRMKSMAKMKAGEKMLKMSQPISVPPTLPGFAGASHLYHVGATGFFLNLSPRIALSANQQGALTQIKSKALFSQNAADRKMEAGEQELWLLTAVDSPSTGKIEAKVREIEKARGDERIAFIQAVGEAAKVLTLEQKAQLLDSAPAPAAVPVTPAVLPATLAIVPLKGSSPP